MKRVSRWTLLAAVAGMSGALLAMTTPPGATPAPATSVAPEVGYDHCIYWAHYMCGVMRDRRLIRCDVCEELPL